MATQTTRPMISETSICNQALSWVGATRITSMDDPSVEGEWCRDNYPFLRDAVLEEGMWTFATARTKSVSVTKDEWESAFKHSLPLDWLMVYRVYTDISNPDMYISDDSWYKEGRFIISDIGTVYMLGTVRITDTGLFTTLFVQALAARLASEMAVPMAENRALQADLWALYQAKIDSALARDGMQTKNERLRARRLHNARGSGNSLRGGI